MKNENLIIGTFFYRKKFALHAKEKLLKTPTRSPKAEYEILKIKGGWILVNKKYL